MKKTGLISLLVVGMLLFTSCGKQEQQKPTVTDTPKKQERLSEDLKQITFRDFGIKDGPYTDTVKQGQYSGESLNGTVFCGKVTFSEEGRARLVLGGTTSQGGFALSTVKDIETGKTVLQLSDSDLDRSGAKFEEYYFNSDVAGVPLIGEELDLKLSIEFVDADKDKKEDDVKLGVWFADKLYNNEYIYLKNYTETGHSMGNWLAVTLQDASITVVSIGSVELETIPEGLRQLTIKDFGSSKETLTTFFSLVTLLKYFFVWRETDEFSRSKIPTTFSVRMTVSPPKCKYIFFYVRYLSRPAAKKSDSPA